VAPALCSGLGHDNAITCSFILTVTFNRPRRRSQGVRYLLGYAWATWREVVVACQIPRKTVASPTNRLHPIDSPNSMRARRLLAAA
jgi:hypothetical protein